MGDEKLERTLATLRDANATPLAGHGSQPDDLMLVGQFYDRRRCQKFVSRLGGKHIEVTRKYVGLKVEIHVRKQHLSVALDEYREHRRLFPDRRPKDISRIYDLPVAIMGIGVLTAIFVTAVMGQPRHALACLVTCLASAWWFYLYRRATLLGGRQFSLLELLTSICFIGVMSALWRYALL